MGKRKEKNHIRQTIIDYFKGFAAARERSNHSCTLRVRDMFLTFSSWTIPNVVRDENCETWKSSCNQYLDQDTIRVDGEYHSTPYV